jgi:hypothetical protein
LSWDFEMFWDEDHARKVHWFWDDAIDIETDLCPQYSPRSFFDAQRMQIK